MQRDSSVKVSRKSRDFCEPTPLSRELPADAGRLAVVPPAPELHFHHHVHKEKVAPRRVKRRGRAPLTLDPSRRSMTTPVIDSTPTTPASARFQRWYSSIVDGDYGVDSTRSSTADVEWDSVSVQKFGDRSRRKPRNSAGRSPFSILDTEEIPENLAEDESDDDADEHERLVGVAERYIQGGQCG
ncbi:hypothetical protein L211DRAFT_892480 [Terfezia boudieri ATCC MYA-4762]|uniref:Uncharacterized protein n=1 Tax=Terfezia boudieri ATCC MYA-4762 TaxID=1051890 RepID=A0A3N4LDT2_9PEZI|nr:hypothetical protein L211DRAFT_892480 [Terfezia boudieri ATCC MYA-4762]